MPFGCFALLAFFALLFLFPLFLANVMIAALAKLGLSPEMSLLAVAAIFLGGIINIPVKRIRREESMQVLPPEMFGFDRWLGRPLFEQSYTIIAVNVGGCIVPGLIAVYELGRLAEYGSTALTMAFLAVALNVVVCYFVARPTPNIGIAMPPFVPALVAAASGLAVGHGLAAPIAFSAGVLGPLIGADLFHLHQVEKTMTGIASIGGAGTFDGIVLSGLVATLLA